MAPRLTQFATDLAATFAERLTRPDTYAQLLVVVAAYGLAYLLAARIRRLFPALDAPGTGPDTPAAGQARRRLARLIGPLLAIGLLRVAIDLSADAIGQTWLLRTAWAVAALVLFHSVVRDFIRSPVAASGFLWLGIPILLLHFLGLLDRLITVLESIGITVGNIQVSLYGLLRVLVFGSLLFWLGRVSSATGKNLIRRQERLDYRTREVAAKMLEVAIVVAVSLLLLQVMGVNLTALAVFSGAVGVGLGFGLQAIASNFISGIIILLDRSISEGDFIELEDGRSGIVRELNMRSTTLETFDGRDIMVPNEKFITASFTNWTHKNKRQRYRVDFSVAYHSDIRALIEIVRGVVASHPQVLSGDDLRPEERPDCEIAGFGDSGINMFVEFWMEGIDDGKNRVGGDLLLLILEALREHGYEIPFPQREVRVLDGPAGRATPEPRHQP
ncbi:MAG: mechanosensitive ion channel family protein [Vicinamibacterales bacterium]